MYSSSTVTDLHISSGCKLNGCASFDGTDDYVDAGNDASLGIGAAITVEAWVNPILPHGDNIGSVVSKRGGNTAGYWLYLNSSNVPSFTINGWDIGDKIITASAAVSGWSHIVGSYDGSNLYIYVNGVKKTQSTTQSSIGVDSTNLEIGKLPGSNNYNYNGLIDEARVYNRALSESEIQAIYNATK